MGSRTARLGLAGLWLLGAVSALAAPWTDLPSDLHPDPAVRSGQLPNGLRYVIRPNAEPKGRVSLRLLVSAGSLHEDGDERGLAHFIEHMAFRGTRGFPHGTLTPALERRGLGMGPDHTAFTSYAYTVYHLELPDPSTETLAVGLNAFREYAGNVTFEPEDLERERGVVISEKDTRNTPQERLHDSSLTFLWPDSRHAHRAPIGLEACIRSFTRAQCVDFYDAWYRPERMAVIVVGDVAPDLAERLVREAFSSLTARGPARPEPSLLVPAHAAAPTVGIYLDEGLAGARMFFLHPAYQPRRADTHEIRVAMLHRALAFAMFTRRLELATRQRDPAFVAPSVTTETFVPGWDTVAFSATCRAENWERLARDLEQAHRRAYLLGFTEDELQLARTKLANSYEQAVRSAPTRRSEWFAAQIAGCLLWGGTLATPEELQRDVAADLAAATLADCAKAFRQAWTGTPPHVYVGSNSAFPASAREVGRVLNASREVAVSRPPPAPPVTFAYPAATTPGQLVHHEHVADLDIHLGEFANGVKLNFKSTPFEADSVTVTVRVGAGRLSQPADAPGLDLLAANALIPGGVARHSSAELDSVLSRHLLNLRFFVEPDACTFSVIGPPRDLELGLQVVAAYLTDAAFRPEAMSDARAALGTLYSNLDSESGGVITLRAERLLASANPRVGLPEADEAYTRTLDELARWLRPQFAHGGIELSIVGDVDWPAASAAVAATLGALPARPASPAPSLPITFARASPKPYLYTLPSNLRQVALAWYWPVADLADVHQERRCRLLASVMAELLNTRLRQELGATYTPYADFVQYDGWPTFSYFTLRADVAFAQGPRAAAIIRREVEAVRAHGIDEDVFLRARQPFLTTRDEDLRNNSYWGFTVLRDAQTRPSRLAAARDRSADTSAITRQDLESLARRYLDPEAGFLFVAEPGLEHFWGRK